MVINKYVRRHKDLRVAVPAVPAVPAVAAVLLVFGLGKPWQGEMEDLAAGMMT